MAARGECVAGHKGCKCRLACCRVTADRGQEITADAQSGKQWVPEKGFGVSPACRCGVRSYVRTALYILDDGLCPRHGRIVELRAASARRTLSEAEIAKLSSISGGFVEEIEES